MSRSSLLSDCPDTLVGKYAKMAERAGSGSRKAAIRLKCLQCCCWNVAEVDRCTITTCALYPFLERGAGEVDAPEEDSQ